MSARARAQYAHACVRVRVCTSAGMHAHRNVCTSAHSHTGLNANTLREGQPATWKKMKNRGGYKGRTQVRRKGGRRKTDEGMRKEVQGVSRKGENERRIVCLTMPTISIREGGSREMATTLLVSKHKFISNRVVSRAPPSPGFTCFSYRHRPVLTDDIRTRGAHLDLLPLFTVIKNDEE